MHSNHHCGPHSPRQGTIHITTTAACTDTHLHPDVSATLGEVCSITVRLSAPQIRPPAQSGEARRPIAALSLAVDVETHELLLWQTDAYQPVFLNGVRVNTPDPIALRDGSVVGIHPSIAAVPLDLKPALSHSPSTHSATGGAAEQPQEAAPIPRAVSHSGTFDLAMLDYRQVVRCPPALDPDSCEQRLPVAMERRLSGPPFPLARPRVMPAQERTPLEAAFASTTRADASFSNNPSNSTGTIAEGAVLYTAKEATVSEAYSEAATPSLSGNVACCPETAAARHKEPFLRAPSSHPTSPEVKAPRSESVGSPPVAAGASGRWHPAGSAAFPSLADAEERLLDERVRRAAAAADLSSLSPLVSHQMRSASRSDDWDAVSPLSWRELTPVDASGSVVRAHFGSGPDMPSPSTSGSASWSYSAALHGVPIAPVALCVAHSVVREGTIEPRQMDGGEAEVKGAAVVATDGGGAESVRRRRFSSLVSDTVLSQRTRNTIRRVSQFYAPVKVGEHRAAATCLLGMLSAHYDPTHQRLLPFAPAERRRLFELCDGILVQCRERLRTTETVLRLRSPLFCCGEVNGSVAALWGAVLQHVCPFGSMSLLTTPLLFLGNYTGRSVAAEANMHTLMLLLVLSVLSPVPVHLIRGRNELLGCGHGNASLLAQCVEFFGQDAGAAFHTQVRKYLTALPLAAIVDDCIFATHRGVPSRHVPPRLRSQTPSFPPATSPSASSSAVVPTETFFDRVLANGVPHRCFRKGGTSRTQGGNRARENQACRRLLRELIGREDGESIATSATFHSHSVSTEPSPVCSTRDLHAFLTRYGLTTVLLGTRGGDAGVRVTERGRVVCLSTAAAVSENAFVDRFRSNGGGCVVAPGMLQLVCWRVEEGQTTTSAVSSLPVPRLPLQSSVPQSPCHDEESTSKPTALINDVPRSADDGHTNRRQTDGNGGPVGRGGFILPNFYDMLTPSSRLHSTASDLALLTPEDGPRPVRRRAEIEFG